MTIYRCETCGLSYQFLTQARLAADETVGHYVVQEGFEDNLVLSTDWPHDDSSYPRALDTFLALERIPQEAKRKILWENCARLYRFA